MAEPLAEIECVAVPDGVRVRILGEIDLSNVEFLSGQLHAAFADVDAAWLDLTVVRYVDTQGVNMVKRMSDAVTMRGATFTVVAAPNSAAGQLLNMTQMSDYLRIVPE